MGDAAAILTALSVVIVALTQFYIAQTARKAATKATVAVEVAERVELRVDAVHEAVGAVADQVATGNGLTIGMLADIAEGRAAQAIPVGDRTASEQTHAAMKEANEDKQQ